MMIMIIKDIVMLTIIGFLLVVMLNTYGKIDDLEKQYSHQMKISTKLSNELQSLRKVTSSETEVTLDILGKTETELKLINKRLYNQGFKISKKDYAEIVGE